MPCGKRCPGRVAPVQRQTNLVKQIGFVLYGEITIRNNRINHRFKEVRSLLPTKNNRKSSDFITIAQARDRFIYYTGRMVSHSTLARWIAQNELGLKLEGKRGQWIVDPVLFDAFLEHVSSCAGGNKPYCRFHYQASRLSASLPG
jgi:hypothetical protein